MIRFIRAAQHITTFTDGFQHIIISRSTIITILKTWLGRVALYWTKDIPPHPFAHPPRRQIITYVLSALQHEDSMGNKGITARKSVHVRRNGRASPGIARDRAGHLLQMWITPSATDSNPLGAEAIFARGKKQTSGCASFFPEKKTTFYPFISAPNSMFLFWRKEIGWNGNLNTINNICSSSMEIFYSAKNMLTQVCCQNRRWKKQCKWKQSNSTSWRRIWPTRKMKTKKLIG